MAKAAFHPNRWLGEAGSANMEEKRFCFGPKRNENGVWINHNMAQAQMPFGVWRMGEHDDGVSVVSFCATSLFMAEQ